jgi:capsular polysaccharide biosynthesis protein
MILGILFIVFGGIFTYKMFRNKKSASTEVSSTEVSSTEVSSTDPASATDITIITDPSSQYRELMDSVSLDSLSEQSLDDGDLLSMLSESSELP